MANRYVLRFRNPSPTLAADAGSYEVTGGAAGLRAGRLLGADAGSYAVTGAAADLRVGRRLGADAGAYAITGTAAGLVADRTIGANAGSYAVTGSDATLTYDEESSGPTWRGNEPSGLTLLDEENWSGVTIPTQSDGGTSGSSWSAVNPSGYISVISDATEPQGSGSAVQVVFPSGLASGSRPGVLYRSMPNIREWYVCSWVRWDTDFEWHPISNKFYFPNAAIHIQASYLGLDFPETQYFSLYNQGGGQDPVENEDYNPPIPSDGEWHLVEWHCDLPGGVSSHWVDGIAVQINAPISNASTFNEFQLDNSWGGAGSAKATTNNRYHGTVYISYGT